MVAVEKVLVKLLPGMKATLLMAHMKDTPEEYVRKALRLSLYASIGLGATAFFGTAKILPAPQVIMLVLAALAGSFFLMFIFFINAPRGMIRKRQRDIDKDVLFAGRYILMKLESGSPIINTLVDASRGYGIAARYFREIVDEINAGVPVEDALEKARSYTSSDKFKRILWQLLTTLKTGTDVTGPLNATLSSLANEQAIEIKEYGKKLNSLMLFYMVTACIAPSLGLAMFLIIASFLNLSINSSALFGILFFLAVLQGSFIIMIKAARPMVEF